MFSGVFVDFFGFETVIHSLRERTSRGCRKLFPLIYSLSLDFFLSILAGPERPTRGLESYRVKKQAAGPACLLVVCCLTPWRVTPETSRFGSPFSVLVALNALSWSTSKGAALASFSLRRWSTTLAETSCGIRVYLPIEVASSALSADWCRTPTSSAARPRLISPLQQPFGVTFKSPLFLTAPKSTQPAGKSHLKPCGVNTFLQFSSFLDQT